MYSAVSNRLQSALAAFQPASCCTMATAAAAAAGAAASGGGKQQLYTAAAAGAHMAAGLELCRLSKLLLVAGVLDAAAAAQGHNVGGD